jgi:hypothetical protein
MEALPSRSIIHSLALLVLCAALPFGAGCKSDIHYSDKDTDRSTERPATDDRLDIHPSVAIKPINKSVIAKIGKPVAAPKGKTGGSGKIILGDLDGDGKVTDQDAKQAIMLSTGKQTPSPKQLAAIDFNHDGQVNVSEVTALRRVVQSKAKASP